jgi:transketolase
MCARGAYELSPAEGEARVTLLATGSEVEVAVGAQALLQSDGIPARVVSVPSFELLFAQEPEARERTLGNDTVRVAVEAMVAFGWDRLLGPRGAFVGMTSFGASAPGNDLYEHFGITPEKVAETAKAHL